MRELLIGTRDERKEDGEACRFAYYILVGEMAVNETFSCEGYGVKIVDLECPEEEVSIPNITISAARIDELMELLTRNSVTPAGLKDVIDDWL